MEQSVNSHHSNISESSDFSFDLLHRIHSDWTGFPIRHRLDRNIPETGNRICHPFLHPSIRSHPGLNSWWSWMSLQDYCIYLWCFFILIPSSVSLSFYSSLPLSNTSHSFPSLSLARLYFSLSSVFPWSPDFPPIQAHSIFRFVTVTLCPHICLSPLSISLYVRIFFFLF